jgi:hypothetical protein
MPDLSYAERSQSKEELADASFAHMAQHRDYIRVVLQRLGKRLDEYPLDPIDPDNMEAWAYHHAIMHQQLDAALGISGYNLLQFDWDDQNLFDLHFDLHSRESGILNL